MTKHKVFVPKCDLRMKCCLFQNPPSPLFKGENDDFALLYLTSKAQGIADMILLPLEKGAGGILKGANLPNHSFRDENFMLGRWFSG